MSPSDKRAQNRTAVIDNQPREMINDQSRKDVEELLSMYVVSPITNSSIPQIKMLIDKTEHLSQNVSSEIRNISSSIKGDLTSLRKLEKLDAISRTLSEENGVVNDISGALDTTKTTVTDISEKMDKEQTTLTDISEKLDKEQTVITGISEKLDQGQTAITDISKKLDAEQKTITGISEKLSTISRQSGNMVTGIRQINTALQEISPEIKKLDDISSMLKDITEQKGVIEQKYKALFTMFLSFGIANVAGFIALIVLFVLK